MSGDPLTDPDYLLSAEDADDRKALRLLQQMAAQSAEVLDRENSMTFALSTTAGRQFVWDILAECGVFSDSFRADPLDMARVSGQRQVGIALLQKIIYLQPDIYGVMQREHAYRQEFYATIPAPEQENEE